MRYINLFKKRTTYFSSKYSFFVSLQIIKKSAMFTLLNECKHNYLKILSKKNWTFESTSRWMFQKNKFNKKFKINL